MKNKKVGLAPGTLIYTGELKLLFIHIMTEL